MSFYLAVFGAMVAVFGVLLQGEAHALSLGYRHAVFYGVAVLWIVNALFTLKFNAYRMIGKISNIVLLALVFGVHSYGVYKTDDERRQMPAAIVQADVLIGEISDSGSDYFRQKAVITHLRAPNNTPKSTTTVDNPFYRPTVAPDHETKYPEKLTVLLTAKDINRFVDAPTAQPLIVRHSYTMTLALSPLVQNEDSFNSYRWLVSRHIDMNAQILAIGEHHASVLPLPDRWIAALQALRAYYREAFIQAFSQNQILQEIPQAQAVTLSLLTGDRALIRTDTKTLYQYAGISHLLAISGTHVLLLAWIMAQLLCVILDKKPTIYQSVMRLDIRLIVMVVVSLGYALFTGFDVPAMRTVYMLIATGLARYFLLPLSSLKVLSIVALVMVFFDPYVLWQAGFWLSFIAVWVLMSYENRTMMNESYTDKLIKIIKLQTTIFIAMLPISLLLFGKVSALGLLVNLFAISLFGLVVVPITLLGAIFYPLSNGLGVLFWSLDGIILNVLHSLFFACQVYLGNGWLVGDVNVLSVLLCTLSFFILVNKIIPKPFAILPMFVACCTLLVYQNTNQIAILDNNQTLQVYIKHNSAQWLILSGKINISQEDKITDILLTELKQKGANYLSGIIIQNDDVVWARIVGKLSLAMNVQRVYWAGGVQSFGNITTSHCAMGDRMILDDNNILKIITGFNIQDNRKNNHADKLKTCSVLIELNNETEVYYKNSSMKAKSILVEGSEYELLWQMYKLLCQIDTPNLIISARDSALTHNEVVMFGNVPVLQ